MNKALHAFVYLFLIGVGVALWYEYQLNDKRTELKDRNRMMEDYLVKEIAPLIENYKQSADDSQIEKPKIEMDAEEVDDPTKADLNKDDLTMKDVLEDIKEYSIDLEKIDRDPLRWDTPQRNALRQVYVLDDEGKPQMDGSEKMTRNSEEDKVLTELVTALKAQREQLKKTREALPPLRKKLEEVVSQYNEVVPQLRQKVKLANAQKDEIESLEKTLTDTSKERDKYKNESKEKDLEISSLRDETENLKNEIEEQKEAIEKSNKIADALKKQIQTLLSQISAATTGGTRTEAGQSISSMPFGDKGKVISADNEYMFAIVEFTPEAMKQLKGDDMNRPVPMVELGVKRINREGKEDFIGRIRLRQEVAGKNYVMCDILSNWSQSKDGIKENDVVFAEQ